MDGASGSLPTDILKPDSAKAAVRARPFIKWVGGKGQLVRELMSLLPKRFNRYWEPFLGGGALFFALSPKTALLSDINKELVLTYTVVRDKVSELIEELSTYHYDRDLFYEVRDIDRDPERYAALSDVKRAARLIYLNKCGFNGLYRVNSKGIFNVPFGRHSNPTILNRSNLSLCSAALQGVEILNAQYFEIEERVAKGDLVYFDPPYVPVSKSSSFTAYTQGGFGLQQQTELRDLCVRLRNRGVYVIASNSDTDTVRELYADFDLYEVFAARSISSVGYSRGAVGEIIAVGGIS
jgi:DNA adenine methylase